MKYCVIVVVLFNFLALSPGAWAASDEAEAAYADALKAYDEASQHLQRSNLREQKRDIVSQALSLTSEQAFEFWPVYDKHEQETTRINDARLAIINDYLSNKSDLAPEKASDLINRIMQAQNDRNEMKRRYVKDLGKVLTAKQALRLLILENQMDLQIDAQIASQIPFK